jgi:hypothetical protein
LNNFLHMKELNPQMKFKPFFLCSLIVSLNAQAEVMFTCGGGQQLAIGRVGVTIAISRDKHEYLIHEHTEFVTGARDGYHTEFGTFAGEPPDFVFSPRAYVGNSTGSEVVTRVPKARPYRARLEPGNDGWILLQKRPMKPLAPSDPGVGIAQCKKGVAVADENAAMLFSAARAQGLLAP